MKKIYNQPQMEIAELISMATICAVSAGLQDGGGTSGLGSGDVISD